MMFLVFFLILIGLGIAASLGRTTDSRDSEYGLGASVWTADRYKGARIARGLGAAGPDQDGVRAAEVQVEAPEPVHTLAPMLQLLDLGRARSSDPQSPFSMPIFARIAVSAATSRADAPAPRVATASRRAWCRAR